MLLHHVSIRTGHIHRAIAFYEQLGFEVCDRFTTGYTLACWMKGCGSRIELIQIPEPQPAPDAFNDEHYTGYYHLSFDLSSHTEQLSEWLAALRAKFQELAIAQPDQFQPLSVLLEPHQQQIGDQVYEVAFIADPDGLPLEFLIAQ